MDPADPVRKRQAPALARTNTVPPADGPTRSALLGDALVFSGPAGKLFDTRRYVTASSPAPVSRNKLPYNAVSRSRTVRRGSRRIIA